MTEEQSVLLDSVMYFGDFDWVEGLTVKENIELFKQNHPDRWNEYVTNGSADMTPEDTVALFNALENDPVIGNMTVQSHNEDVHGLFLVNEDTKEIMVSFRGTSDNEWIDNAEALVMESSVCQRNALEWLEKQCEMNGYTADEYYLSVCGHSKGANKAAYCAILSDYVDAAIAYDAEGFSYEFRDALTPEQYENAKKILYISNESDPVSQFAWKPETSKIQYYEGNGDFAHYADTIFSFDKNGNVVMNAKRNGPTVTSQALYDTTKEIMDKRYDALARGDLDTAQKYEDQIRAAMFYANKVLGTDMSDVIRNDTYAYDPDIMKSSGKELLGKMLEFQIREHADDLVNDYKNALVYLKNQAVDAYTFGTDILKDGWNALKEEGSEAIHGFMGQLKDSGSLLSNIFDNGATTIADIWNNPTDFFKHPLDYLGKNALENVRAISNYLGQTGERVKDGVEDLIQDGKDLINYAGKKFEVIGNKLESGWNKLKDGAGELVHKGEKFINGVDRLKDHAVGMIKSTDTYQNAKKWFDDRIDDVHNAGQKAVNTISNTWNKGVKAVTNFGKNIGQSVSNFFGH